MPTDEDYEEARQKAKDRYDFDIFGILLNTLVSATSSLTAGGLLSLVESTESSRMPLIVGVIFVAQVVPKLLVELSKAYRVNQAKRDGYERGFVESNSLDREENRVADYCVSLCDHSSYF